MRRCWSFSRPDSLADAELTKDAVEEVSGSGLAGDFAQGIQGGAQVYGDEVQRQGGGKGGLGGGKLLACAAQRVLVAGAGDEDIGGLNLAAGGEGGDDFFELGSAAARDGGRVDDGRAGHER